MQGEISFRPCKYRRQKSKKEITVEGVFLVARQDLKSQCLGWLQQQFNPITYGIFEISPATGGGGGFLARIQKTK